MNIKSKIQCLGLILTISSLSFFSQAKNSDNRANLETYKCHVSLISGEETIHYLTTNKTKASNIVMSLSGGKAASYTSGKVFNIYEVIECVVSKSKFTDKKSRILDDKIPR